MPWFSKFVLFYIVCSLPFAMAQERDCAPTPDLSEGLGPVYNQGDELSSCFANAAADQLTQRMQREGGLRKDERIQPLALWALYTLDDGRVPNGSKNTVSTLVNVFNSLWGLKERGLNMLCRESEFGAEANEKHPLFSQAEATRMAKFREHLEAASAGACSLNNLKNKTLGNQILEVKNAAYFLWWNSIKGNCHTAIPKMTWQWYWEQDRTSSIQQNKIKKRSPSENRLLAERIDAALSKKRIAGIEYQASFLLSEKKQFVHWSNIVQRKPMGGKCYYRIRDSFGPDCKRYKNPEQCKDGYIWVEKQELLDHTDAVTYLE